MGIAAMMMIVSPGYIAELFTHPWGKHMIAAAAVCLVLAHLVIAKIVKIEA
jgi:Flp pilus assembly protein TadB